MAERGEESAEEENEARKIQTWWRRSREQGKAFQKKEKTL